MTEFRSYVFVLDDYRLQGETFLFFVKKKLEVYSFCLRQFHASTSRNVNRLKVKKKKKIFPIEFILVCPKTVIRRIGKGNVEILKCYSNATFRSTRFIFFCIFLSTFAGKKPMMEYRKSQKGKSCEQMSELDRLRQAEDKEQRHTNRKKKNAGSFSDGGTSRNRGEEETSFFSA